jgi:branched-subunit amino acid transport protein
MTNATIWLTMFLAGALTFLTRLSFIALWGRWMPPEWLRRALRYVPPAVLTAIIFPEVLIREGAFNPFSPRLLAGLVAALVAWRTKNIVWTILAGMGALLVLQAFWL